jgi:arylsulfatase A-like enzyme
LLLAQTEPKQTFDIIVAVTTKIDEFSARAGSRQDFRWQVWLDILFLRSDESLKLLRVIVLLLSAVWDLPVHGQTPARAQSRPNVVLILMDDLGYGDIGSFGVRDARTPNIDRLGREGVKLTQFYANGPNCSPTRTGFITGRYQQRYDIEWPLGTLATDSVRGVLPSPTSLPRLLKSAGYATGLIGKWHLGWSPQFSPNRHGFDEFWGFLGGYLDYYNNMGEFNRHDLFHNDSATSTPVYLTDEITTRAQSFIRQHANAPFFVEVAYNATHSPFQPPGLPEAKRERKDRVRDGTRADYVAMLESADRGVGIILRTLDSLKLTRNTLVIFTSDNGGEWLSRNAPLFHRKSTLWEGGIRVPALMRWPGHLRAGKVSTQVGITMDLTASIVALAHVTAPPSYHPDGIDIVSLVSSGRSVERTLFWRSIAPARPQRAVRQGKWKYLRDGNHEFLFDLTADVGERNDLAAARADMLPRFRALVKSWEADVDSSRAALSPGR